MGKVATSRRRRNVSERASDIGTVHTQVDLALRFVDSCVYARRSGVRIRRNLCIHTHRSRKRTDPRIHTSHPGAFTYTCTPAAYTHPPLAYTHRPAYTHPGAYMHPLRIRTPACVYTPTCVYAPRVRIRTHPRKRLNAPTSTTAYKHICVNAASDAKTHLSAYTHPTLRIRTRGRDERHVEESVLRGRRIRWVWSVEGSRLR